MAFGGSVTPKPLNNRFSKCRLTDSAPTVANSVGCVDNVSLDARL